MKKYFLSTGFFAAFFICLMPSLQAQKNKGKQPVEAMSVASTPDAYSLQKSIYNKALGYNDFEVAKNAIYTMLALKPEDTSMKDSLAIIYYNMSSYVPCILLGREILEKNKNNPTMLEITAASERNMGLLPESLDRYQTLYGITNSVFHLFQVASVQFDMQKYEDCKSTLDRVISNPDSDKQQVVMQTQQGQQPVPVKAAAYNMHGIISMTNKDPQNALVFIEKALQAYPEFELAKMNKEAIQKEVEQNNAPSPKAPATNGSKKKK